MVNWKFVDSLERLLAAIIASNSNKLDYKAIATFFGQDATYHTIEHHCRKYRGLADKLRTEAVGRGAAVGSSGTPRGSQNRISKPATPFTGRSKKSAAKGLATPGKSGSRKSAEDTLMEAILLDCNDDSDADTEGATEPKVKSEKPMLIPSVEESKYDVQAAPKATSMVGVVVPAKQEDVFTGDNEEESAFVSSIRSRRSAAPPQESDSDEYMDSGDDSRVSPTPTSGRSRTRGRGQPRKTYVFTVDSEDEDVA